MSLDVYMIGDVTDDHLIGRMAQGNLQALDLFYDRYAADIYQLAQKLVGSQTKAEAILEETFWQAWCQADEMATSQASATTWLYRTARQLALTLVN